MTNYKERLIKVLSRFLCFFTVMGIIYIHASTWHARQVLLKRNGYTDSNLFFELFIN